MKRVSSFLTSLVCSLTLIWKCLTHTVPLGNAHLPSGENAIAGDPAPPMVPSNGNTSQRSFSAASDHRAELTVNGTMAGLGVSADMSEKTPVAESCAGICDWLNALFGNTPLKYGPIGTRASRPGSAANTVGTRIPRVAMAHAAACTQRPGSRVRQRFDMNRPKGSPTQC